MKSIRIKENLKSKGVMTDCGTILNPNLYYLVIDEDFGKFYEYQIFVPEVDKLERVSLNNVECSNIRNS